TADRNALASIARQSDKQGIEVLIAKADMHLNERQREVVGKAPVYDITVKSGGKKISTFEGGSMTIALPYELKAGELPNRVVIRYVDEMGNVEDVKSRYDVKAKQVVFQTDHLSKYVISYEPWVNLYRDVNEDDWYFQAVKFIAERNFMSGTGEEMFSPSVLTTRGMLVSILHRMEELPKAGDNPFVDVADGMYYTEAVKWAFEKDIVKGYSTDTFGPNDHLTREQVALIMRNYAQYKGANAEKTSDLSIFEDGESVSPWAMSALEWAHAEGIVSGKPGMMLDPKGYATRAEIATILMKWIEMLNQ
ncbi:MAG: S-layer homology domain-containing protein, partial [Bacillota bacterium]|nr:S-layer homology domain-containing protein [Bacillota bacterium]